MPIIEHSPIDQTWMLLGVSLEVLVVCGDHPEAALIIEAVQQGLGNSSTDGGLGTSSEFINE